MALISHRAHQPSSRTSPTSSKFGPVAPRPAHEALRTPAPPPDPRQAPNVAGAIPLQLANNRACALLDGGRAVCRGGSLECGDTDHASTTAPAPDLDRKVQFVRAAGSCFWCAMDSEGGLSCDGPPNATVHIAMPGVTTIAAGDTHACAARVDGSVWCWGTNTRGELGRETLEMKEFEPGPAIWSTPSSYRGEPVRPSLSFGFAADERSVPRSGGTGPQRPSGAGRR